MLCPEEGLYGVDIPKNVWHNVESLELGTVLLEAKDGAYHPLEEDEIMEVKS